MSTKNFGELFGVVIRQVQNNRPVVSAIINKSEDKDVDDQIHYLLSKGEEHMQESVRYKQRSFSSVFFFFVYSRIF